MVIGGDRYFDAANLRQVAIQGHDPPGQGALRLKQPALVLLGESSSFLEEGGDLWVTAQFRPAPGEVEPDLEVSIIGCRVSLESCGILSSIVGKASSFQQFRVARIGEEHLMMRELKETAQEE